MPVGAFAASWCRPSARRACVVADLSGGPGYRHDGVMHWLLSWITAAGRALRALLQRLGLIRARVGGAASPREVGRWDPVFSLPNVAIHTHLLPDGRVLLWGRRDDPAG